MHYILYIFFLIDLSTSFDVYFYYKATKDVLYTIMIFRDTIILLRFMLAVDTLPLAAIKICSFIEPSTTAMASVPIMFLHKTKFI